MTNGTVHSAVLAALVCAAPAARAAMRTAAVLPSPAAVPAPSPLSVAPSLRPAASHGLFGALHAGPALPAARPPTPAALPRPAGPGIIIPLFRAAPVRTHAAAAVGGRRTIRFPSPRSPAMIFTEGDSFYRFETRDGRRDYPKELFIGVLMEKLSAWLDKGGVSPRAGLEVRVEVWTRMDESGRTPPGLAIVMRSELGDFLLATTSRMEDWDFDTQGLVDTRYPAELGYFPGKVTLSLISPDAGVKRAVAARLMELGALDILRTSRYLMQARVPIGREKELVDAIRSDPALRPHVDGANRSCAIAHIGPRRRLFSVAARLSSRSGR